MEYRDDKFFLRGRTKPLNNPSMTTRIKRYLETANHLFRLDSTFVISFAFLFMYVLIFNREGFFVPSNNEFLYLPQLAKLWSSNFLSNDWTFSRPLTSHFVFNLVFGPLTLLFPLEVVGWIGRFFSWSLILLALFRLGELFLIPLWMVSTSILLWLFYAQSNIGGEWIFGTFEAKCITYALIFFSLIGFTHHKKILPSIYLGLAFSFHPIVGLWGALAIGLSLIILKYPTSDIFRYSFYATIFALPGMVPVLLTVFEADPTPFEVQKFVSLMVMPFHFDPFSFRRDRILSLFILLGFNWLHFILGNKSHNLRLLITFQAFLGLFFVLTIVARASEKFSLLMIMPGRLFPILMPLFFFLHLMNALHRCCAIRFGKVLLVSGFLSLSMFGNPVLVLFHKISYHYRDWVREEDELGKTFRWIAANTPRNSIVILPPWRKDAFYLSQRAQIVNWHILTLDRLSEWSERLKSMVGDLSSVSDATEEVLIEKMRNRYDQLTMNDITIIMKEYGADYLVSPTTYPYSMIFQSGIYKVYSLEGALTPNGRKRCGEGNWSADPNVRLQGHGG